MKNMIAGIVLAAILFSLGIAAEAGAAKQVAKRTELGAKDVAHGTTHGAKSVAHGTVGAGKSVARGTVNGVKSVGHGFKKMAHDVF